MNNIFISHSMSVDDAIARRLAKDLEDAGLQVWIAQNDIPVGVDFIEKIQTGLLQCDCFILLASNAAKQSRYVELEIFAAVDLWVKKGITIIPLRLEQCELSPIISRFKGLPLENYEEDFPVVLNYIVNDTLQERKEPITSRKIFTTSSGVYSLAVAPLDGLIAAGTYSGIVELIDPLSKNPSQRIPVSLKPIHALKFSSDNKLLASAGEDDSITLIDWKSQKPLVILKGHEATVTSLAFSPDNHKLVSGSRDKSIKIWDVEKFELIKSIFVHEESVYCVDWSPDGKWIASGSSDNTVRISNPSGEGETIKLGRMTGTILSVKFSPNGEILASGQWGGVTVPKLVNDG